MNPAQNKKSAQRARGSILLILVGFIAAIAVLVVLGVAYVVLLMGPKLPDLDALTNFQPKVPLRVYTEDKVLIGEFGEERRSIVKFQDIPDVMKKAVLAIEDYRFYEHGGVDFVGIARAGVADLVHGGAAQGASTITMQVARNFFLSRDKTYSRKIYEMLLAYKIEAALSKDQILELYMNQIFLGQRAYGFASAERVYFGKDLKDITLPEAAMLAGLPKAPSAYNPVVNFKRAKIRQEYILKRMYELKYITQEQYDEAVKAPLHVVEASSGQFAVHGEYIAEMVRQSLYGQYKEDAYTKGFSVYTTVNSVDQTAAYKAVRAGVMDYDRRHGYRGPEGNIEIPVDPDALQDAIDDALAQHPDNDELIAAVVTAAGPKSVTVIPSSGETITISGDGLKFAASALKPNAKNGIHPGSIIRISKDAKDNWQVTQLPQVEGALVAIAPDNGAIKALVGGFEADGSKFNHVTQAWRQPGSTFKPFIYSAALEKGVGPATLVNDAAFTLAPTSPGQDPWSPKDDDEPEGPITLRRGLQKSKNLVAVRTLNFIGTGYAQQYITRFGFDAAKNPAYLPMALGAGAVTPIQLVNGYAVFANGGYRVNPWLISEVHDARGTLLSRFKPIAAGKDAPRVIDARNAYIMNSLLQTVAQRGTGAGSNVLGRSDLAGKTGTTNDAVDGWFAGYQRNLVAVTWLGYDQPKSLGSREFGAQLALPLWVSFMGKALQGVPESQMPMPDNVVNIEGELYFDNMTPGNGFVAGIDLGAGNADEPDQADASSPNADDNNDRQKVIDLFKN
ncbi:penicillin-binding protein 1A [Silvimonas terrae]|uniref:Penicillin-binding protein 1A n=1 Tax=Silvimonas terrae TaxID=300266 RepID=A0A840RB20_9NEIS|nr:penicillin-binding protein 1A [Silvimonas terrae]MBB5189540.1 penicillin-binding protein 1A [Silvimonas terrae]